MAEPMLIGAVAAQDATVAAAVVLETLRRGVEDVVAHSMGIELTWSSTASTVRDDLDHPSAPTGADGVDPDFVATRWSEGPPESGAFSARSTVMQAAVREDFRRYDPRMEAAWVACTFPTTVAWSATPVGGMIVTLTMQRWAMYGSGARLDWAVGALERWVHDASEALGATAGFITAATHPVRLAESPWECANRLSPSRRDVANQVWGFGWSTLLGPRQLEAVGGPGAVEGLAEVSLPLRDGGTWIRLPYEDPADVTDRDLDALQRRLAPALP
ncbi:hypothetical protein [Demequina capsici]|uniref:Uncharacterized protein n=1 Tax=Demequina capsici TaxID=3075620 RepID=A0AA96F870_9MICO|nr:hypothetical protein [Demequina sp. OYTSA14]WNM25207.1 hypothetical protein RN606_03400 [Demequina sp. OYTSA14]